MRAALAAAAAIIVLAACEQAPEHAGPITATEAVALPATAKADAAVTASGEGVTSTVQP